MPVSIPSRSQGAHALLWTLGFSVAAVALGIALLVEFRPTPEYWREWSLRGHAVSVVLVLAAGGAAGGWITRDPMRSALVALASLFLVGGMVLWINAAFDRAPARVLEFEVQGKERTWVERSRNSYWDHRLVGRTAEGRVLGFSAHVGNISLADWERADPRRGDRVEVEEHPGFLAIPWWRIRGLATAP